MFGVLETANGMGMLTVPCHKPGHRCQLVALDLQAAELHMLVAEDYICTDSTWH